MKTWRTNVRRHQERGAPNLDQFLASLTPPGREDEVIAMLIDDFARRADVEPLDIADFKKVVPKLEARPVVLDAVVEAAIRTHMRGGRTRPEVIRLLKREHPDLSDAIDASIAMSELLGSDGGATPSIRFTRELPCDIGPMLPDGRARYCVRERLNAGAQGEVYLGVDRHLSSEDRPGYVAVKFLHRSERAPDEEATSREAKRARRISHPNVARVLDRGATPEGEPFQVYEYIDGGSLEQAFGHGVRAQSARDCAGLMVSVAKGLQAVHSAGLLHCDLKPSNVLMTRDGLPKVSDFGISRLIDVGRTGREFQERSGYTLAGALGFSCPELHDPDEMLDCTVDTYALGALLAWCLTGEPPNGATPLVARSNLQRKDSSGPVNPAILATIRDPDLAAICRRAMDRHRANRYQSAEAFAADLERYLRFEPIPWVTQSRIRSVSRWVRRERVAVVASFVGLASVALGVAWVAKAQERADAAAKDKQAAEVEARIAEDQWSTTQRAILESFKVASAVKRDKDDWFAQVSIIDAMSGPLFASNAPGVQDLWKNRIDIALQKAGDYNANGVSVMGLLCQQLAGFWLVRAGRYVEATGLLVRVKACWADMGDPARGLGEFSEMLLAIAMVMGADADRESPTNPSDLAWASNVVTSSDPLPIEVRESKAMMELLGQARARLNANAGVDSK